MFNKSALITFGGVLVASLVGCGGGGGSGGTPSSGPPPALAAVVVNSDPVLAGVLRDPAGALTSSISASGVSALNVTLSDPGGKGIPNQVVSASGDATKVIFPEGSSGLTNAAGIATIKIARASFFATGADALVLSYSYRAGSLATFSNGSAPPTADKVVSRYIGYQLAVANISLANLNVGGSMLAAYGTRQITVQANINGASAGSTPVQVSFTSNCGTITPATALTNSQGIAQVSYSAVNAGVINDQGCSASSVAIAATTPGAAPVSAILAIDVAPATNLLFVEAKPSTIFLAGSGGTTQSVVKFRLVNTANVALQGQDVLLELKDLAGGIPKTSFGTVGNVAAIVQPTNASGEIVVPVFSGTVPTNVSVKASLISNANVATISSVLAIASGRAVQARASLSVEKLSIEGANVDGVTTTVSMSLADRQGNPVPEGTAVNFVTEGGVLIPPVCTTVNSACTVTLRSQNPRPANGRVSILAYAAGEEDFIDLNFDNVYTVGEPFTDLGNAFRDDAAVFAGDAGLYVQGYFSVPRAGSVTCSGGFLGRPNSCDGVWGAADVRQQAIVIFATGAAVIAPQFQTGNNLTFSVADGNLNSVPTGSAIAVSASPATCAITNGGNAIVANSLSAAVFSTSYATTGGAPCAGGTLINVKVTTPLGLITSASFPVATTPPVALSALSGPRLDVFTDSFRLTTVLGGIGPFTVSSNDRTVATATLSGSELRVTGVSAGSATIVINDATGSSYRIVVTVN